MPRFTASTPGGYGTYSGAPGAEPSTPQETVPCADQRVWQGYAPPLGCAPDLSASPPPPTPTPYFGAAYRRPVLAPRPGQALPPPLAALPTHVWAEVAATLPPQLEECLARALGDAALLEAPSGAAQQEALAFALSGADLHLDLAVFGAIADAHGPAMARARSLNLAGIDCSSEESAALGRALSKAAPALVDLQVDGHGGFDLNAFLCQIRGLRSLDLAFNQLTQVPAAVAQMADLEHLDVTENALASADAILKHLPAGLKTLILGINALPPAEVQRLEKGCLMRNVEFLSA